MLKYPFLKISIIFISIAFLYSCSNDDNGSEHGNNKKSKKNAVSNIVINKKIGSYSWEKDKILDDMYLQEYWTYLLLFGRPKYQEIIEKYNPLLKSDMPERTVIIPIKTLYYPLVLIEPEEWHKRFLDKKKTVMIVDLDTDVNAVYLYKGDTLMVSANISQGKDPVNHANYGKYILNDKLQTKISYKYDNASMPWACYLYEHFFIHAGEVMTGTDSHGCIRVPYCYAKEIFDIIKKGDEIIVAASNKIDKLPPTTFLPHKDTTSKFDRIMKDSVLKSIAKRNADSLAKIGIKVKPDSLFKVMKDSIKSAKNKAKLNKKDSTAKKDNLLDSSKNKKVKKPHKAEKKETKKEENSEPPKDN